MRYLEDPHRYDPPPEDDEMTDEGQERKTAHRVKLLKCLRKDSGKEFLIK